MLPQGLALRVAMRQVYGAFFNVGDIILFGKYKNKKGRIVSFSENEKGQPLVEIEPIPKGRKQNKVLGLFKIWNLAVVEKSQKDKEASMDPLASRVASRFLTAKNVPFGKDLEVGKIRIHRFVDHFKVTDLTNAGKRGKRCRTMTIAPTFYFKGDHKDWMERMSKALPDYGTIDEIDAFIRDILADHPNEIRTDKSEERGVDVNPGGTVKIEFDTVTGPDTSLEVTAEPKDFMIVHRWKIRHKDEKPGAPANDTGTDTFQDTIYASDDKVSAQVFYNWLGANLNEAKRMDIRDFQNLWHELKISYDSH